MGRQPVTLQLVKARHARVHSLPPHRQILASRRLLSQRKEPTNALGHGAQPKHSRLRQWNGSIRDQVGRPPDSVGWKH